MRARSSALVGLWSSVANLTWFDEHRTERESPMFMKKKWFGAIRTPVAVLSSNLQLVQRTPILPSRSGDIVDLTHFGVKIEKRLANGNFNRIAIVLRPILHAGKGLASQQKGWKVLCHFVGVLGARVPIKNDEEAKRLELVAEMSLKNEFT